MGEFGHRLAGRPGDDPGLANPGGRIFVDLVEHGDLDPSCCPGDMVSRGYQLEFGKSAYLLGFDVPFKRQRLSLAAIEGSSWSLSHWNGDYWSGLSDPITEKINITLAVKNGRLVGRVGCVTYSAKMRIRYPEAEAFIAIDGINTKREDCPKPARDLERGFLKQLKSVTQFGVEMDRLWLATPLLTMHFDRVRK